jgi:hypothetical protein
MSKDTGGPAFPRTQWPNETGMTLRDYFAARAMQMLVNENYFDVSATLAYKMADAMLKAREQ